MDRRIIVLIVSLRVIPCSNGKSHIDQFKEAVLPSLQKLPPGDCVVLVDANGLEAYEQPGEWTVAILNVAHKELRIAKALQDSVDILEGIAGDVEFYIFTDRYDGSNLTNITDIRETQLDTVPWKYTLISFGADGWSKDDRWKVEVVDPAKFSAEFFERILQTEQYHVDTMPDLIP